MLQDAGPIRGQELLSWQYISAAPNLPCQLSPPGKTHTRLSGSISPSFLLGFFQSSLKLSVAFLELLLTNANMNLFVLLLPFALECCLGIRLLSRKLQPCLGSNLQEGEQLENPNPLG